MPVNTRKSDADTLLHKHQVALETENKDLRRINIDLEKRVIERTVQLQGLAVELTQAEERERRRLAQILHDQLQQMLFGAKLRLGFLREHSEQPPFQEQITQLEDLLTGCIEFSRSLGQELSPPVLHDMGLPAGLKWLGRWMKDHHGLSVELQLDDERGPDDQTMRLVLFRSIRELLFNVVKHAGVSTAGLQMKRLSKREVQITVTDQGAGCDPARLLSNPPSGFGLRSIRERLELFGGRLEIESVPGHGSRFILIAPLQPTGVSISSRV
jgi:signal transduction histidine kinase